MRVAVVGTSGAGKSTLARRLADTHSIPHVELDAINWQSGWRALVHEDPAEFVRRVEAAVSGPAWICDGNYSQARGVVWDRATDLIWLDYDRPTIMVRVLKRSVLRSLDPRPMWADNREDWRRWLRPSHPIRWAWSTWRRRRADFEALIEGGAFAHLAVHRCRHPRDAEALLQGRGFR